MEIGNLSNNIFFLKKQNVPLSDKNTKMKKVRLDRINNSLKACIIHLDTSAFFICLFAF